MLIQAQRNTQFVCCSCNENWDTVKEALECCGNQAQLYNAIRKYEKAFNIEMSRKPEKRDFFYMRLFLNNKHTNLCNIRRAYRHELSSMFENVYDIEWFKNVKYYMNKVIKGVDKKVSRIERDIEENNSVIMEKLNGLPREDLISIILANNIHTKLDYLYEEIEGVV